MAEPLEGSKPEPTVKNNSKNGCLGGITILRKLTILREGPLKSNLNEGGPRGSSEDAACVQLAKQEGGTPERTMHRSHLSFVEFCALSVPRLNHSNTILVLAY